MGGSSTKRSGTAVVVVHGVSDQQPGETVRAVSALLGASGGWVETQAWCKPTPAGGEEVGGADAQFPVVTLKGTVAARDVALYEVYWADLSRPGRGLVEMLRSLFGVLSVLPRVSIAMLHETMRMDPGPKGAAPNMRAAWLLAAARYLMFGMVLPFIYAGLGATLGLAIAVRVHRHPHLTDPWVCGGLLLLAIGASASIHLVGLRMKRLPAWGRWIAIITEVAVFVLTALLAHRVPSSQAPLLMVGLAIAWVALGMYLFGRLRAVHGNAMNGRKNDGLVLLALVGLAAAGVWVLFGDWRAACGAMIGGIAGPVIYGQMPSGAGKDGGGGPERPFDVVAGGWSLASGLSLAVWCVLCANHIRAVRALEDGTAPWVHACFDLVQLAYAATTASFAVACGAVLLAIVVALFEVRGRPSHRTAFRTALLSVIAPMVLLVLLTSPTVAAVAHILHVTDSLELPAASVPSVPAWDTLDSLEQYDETWNEHRPHELDDDERIAREARDADEVDLSIPLMRMARASGTSLVPVLVGLFLLLVVGCCMLLIPPALASTLPDETRTERTSTWLQGATEMLVGFAAVVGALVLLTFLLGALLELAAWAGASAPAWTESLLAGRKDRAAASGQYVATLGVAVAGGAALLAFPERLRSLLAPIWPALDILADVVNYLDPEDETKHKIVARARTVLARGAEHERLIVVAHSQGTVIAFDVLARKSVDVSHLLTCGSPLAHLYHRFFPHAFRKLVAAQKDPASMLKVARWTNVYAASDYVGMRLDDVTSTQPKAFEQERLTSIGHTSYFAPDNAEMAKLLRDLV